MQVEAFIRPLGYTTVTVKGFENVNVNGLLDITAAHATRYLETVKTNPIATTASLEDLRS
jgi:hypothetical protein